METVHSKHALQSKTIQGIVALLLATIVPLLTGIELEDSHATAQKVIEVVSPIVALAAAAWAAYGRTKAADPIHFKPAVLRGLPVPRTDPVARAILDNQAAPRRAVRPRKRTRPVKRSEPGARPQSLTYRETKRT